MNKIKNTKSTSRINYLLILILLLISSKTSLLVESDLTLLLVTLFTISIFLLQKLEVDGYFFKISLIYFLLIPLYYINFGHIDIIPTMGLYLKNINCLLNYQNYIQTFSYIFSKYSILFNSN